MELLRFDLGEEGFPVFRTLSERDSRMLRALLGAGFEFELVDGEPMDAFLFEVLCRVATEADFLFAAPAGASVLGTFRLRDACVPAPPPRASRARPRLRPRVH